MSTTRDGPAIEKYIAQEYVYSKCVKALSEPRLTNSSERRSGGFDGIERHIRGHHGTKLTPNSVVIG